MILTTIQAIPEKRIVAHYGMVAGSSVRARHLVYDALAALKNLFGGELAGYSKLLEDARKEATDRMVKQAETAGANAVIGVRYGTSQVASGAAEIFAYGTAVKVE
jgi:uncharacterized protein YbjQ (UPF0145 family)